jgi:hypothetical protein
LPRTGNKVLDYFIKIIHLCLAHAAINYFTF